MATLSSCLYKWKLKFSTTKTVWAAFHLYNRESRRELNVFANGQALPFCVGPTYVGTKLDRTTHVSPTLRVTAEEVNILRWAFIAIGRSSWDADASVLRTATLAMVHSMTEYCSPVWCSSAHTGFIDNIINNSLRIVNGCRRPTPTAIFLSYQASKQLSFASKKLHCL